MRQLMERHRSDARLCRLPCPDGSARPGPGAVRRRRAVSRDGEEAAGHRYLRTTDHRRAVRRSGRELAALIAGPRRRDFHRCLTEKMLTYAIGRGVEYFDAPAVDNIVKSAGRRRRLIDARPGRGRRAFPSRCVGRRSPPLRPPPGSRPADTAMIARASSSAVAPVADRSFAASVPRWPCRRLDSLRTGPGRAAASGADAHGRALRAQRRASWIAGGRSARAATSASGRRSSRWPRFATGSR